MTPIRGFRSTRCFRLAVGVATLLSVGCAARPGRDQSRAALASVDIAAYRSRAPALERPLTLEQALDYAASYNIEVWIAAQEREFQHELATHSLLKMLPSLVFGAESSRRSRYDAASSQSLATGQQSLEPSFSSEKDRRIWDVSATWSLLDFGISYLRARQQAGRELIAAERERRVRQNLALEVTRAYWQAITARESALEAARVAGAVTDGLQKIAREIQEKAISEIDGLRRETRLLEQQEELRRYKRAYLAAKAELASLIGLPPGTPFALAYVYLDESVLPLTFDVEKLEWEALRSRPELFEKDLEQAISRDEAHIALAQMFPNVSAFWGYNVDHNRFLAFDEWNAAGLRLSWNLLTIPAQIKQREAVKLQTELIGKRRMAIAVAILTQLHLALIDYEEALDKHEITTTISRKHHELLVAIESAAEDGKSHGGESLDHRMKYLKARARHLSTYATLMIAHARLLNTIGRDDGRENDVADEGAAPPDPERAGESAGKGAAPDRTLG